MQVKLLKVNVYRDKISKDRTLEDISDIIRVDELKISYEKYMEPALVWSTEDQERIVSALDVKRVVPMGGYIRGLFGGEKKEGKQKYAGLVVERYEEHDDFIVIKLVNLDKAYQVPMELMKRYDVNIYKLYYVGLINPFKSKTCNVLLSKEEKNLKDFLEKLIKINQEVITRSDMIKLKILKEELQISLDQFNESSYYTIYRRSRIFTACVPEDLKMSVSYDDVAYLECKSLEQAHYYAAVLNYLAYKVIESERAFIRHQYARPAIAIAVAGLSWKNVSDEIKREVASLSEQLSKELEWKDYTNQKVALQDIARTFKFRKILNLFDSCVDINGLSKALDLVSAKKQKREKSINDDEEL